MEIKGKIMEIGWRFALKEFWRFALKEFWKMAGDLLLKNSGDLLEIYFERILKIC